jgi:hypothetical protein
MVKSFYFILILLINFSCTNPQTSKSTYSITGDSKKDLVTLLPNGNFTVDVMDSIKTTKRQLELIKKFQQSLLKNQEWYMEYIKNAKPGAMLPYHPNFGITEDEYKELINSSNNFEQVSTGKVKIQITNNGKVITFKSQGKLNVLNYVEINIESNKVKIGDYSLNFSEPVEVNDENNALKSKWKGYNWRFEYPANFSNQMNKSDENLQIKSYKLTLGLIEKTGKQFLQIKGNEMNNGKRVVTFDLPIIF